MVVGDLPSLIEAGHAGAVRAIARLITIAENGGDRAAQLAGALTSVPRRSVVIGITGAPGAGKSTLTGALLRRFRDDAASGGARSVAVLAVDPSSPFSGGALLGDRVRMSDFATDPGVFIRSLSSRGSLGGISAGTPAAVDVASALGFDIVVIETVGVGQSEVEIMHLADTVAVVLAPGMGDAVQAAKAGIMEIADLLVVNKADHAGARATIRELKYAAGLAGDQPSSAPSDTGDDDVDAPTWRTPIVSTVASDGTGAAECVEVLDRHREYLTRSGRLIERQRQRAATGVHALVMENARRILAGEAGRQVLASQARSVVSGDSDQYRAAARVLQWLTGPK